MKKITVPMNNKSYQNVYVGQVGKHNDKEKRFPKADGGTAFGIKVVYSQTSSSMSQGQGHKESPYDLRFQIADLRFKLQSFPQGKPPSSSLYNVQFQI